MNRFPRTCFVLASLAASNWALLPNQTFARGYGEVAPRPNVRPPMNAPANSTPVREPAATPISTVATKTRKPANALNRSPAGSLLLRLVVPTTHDGNPLFSEAPAAIDTHPRDSHERIPPKELWGVWSIVRSDPAGRVSTVEFVINERGWADITRPAASGQYSTTRHRFQFSNDVLTLTRSGRALVVGKLIEVSPRQLVIQAKDRTLTFVRRAAIATAANAAT